MSGDGRGTVLASVRRALGRPAAGADPAGERAAGDRLRTPRANLVPMRAQLQQPQLGELFDEMARASGATLAHVADLDAVPAAVGTWCAETGVDPRAVVAPSSPLAGLAWSEAGVDVEARPIRSGDGIGLSTALGGLAETGTLALGSGPGNPTLTNFLAEAHLIVLRASDVVGTPEDLWAVLREAGPLPRTVNWITGPSRTADIEMTMAMGAHGPVRLHVLVVDD
jgi:L-lactate dehydrogenase complex protein LldG